jgi:hypothetical protein
VRSGKRQRRSFPDGAAAVVIIECIASALPAGSGEAFEDGLLPPAMIMIVLAHSGTIVSTCRHIRHRMPLIVCVNIEMLKATFPAGWFT